MKTKLGNPVPMSTRYHKPTLSQRTNGAVRAPVRNGLFGKALASSPQSVRRAGTRLSPVEDDALQSFSNTPNSTASSPGTSSPLTTSCILTLSFFIGVDAARSPNEGLNLRNNIPLEIGRSPRSTPDKEPYPTYSRCVLDRHPPDHEGHATNHPLLTGAIDT